MAFNNWNYIKKASLAERMNDIYYSSLAIIINERINSDKNEKLKQQFITEITREGYVN